MLQLLCSNLTQFQKLRTPTKQVRTSKTSQNKKEGKKIKIWQNDNNHSQKTSRTFLSSSYCENRVSKHIIVINYLDEYLHSYL